MKRVPFNLSDAPRIRPFLSANVLDRTAVVIERCDACKLDWAVLVRVDGSAPRILGKISPC